MGHVTHAAVLALCMAAAPARADDVWLGLYKHDVTLSNVRFERGVDLKAGWIGKPIDGLASIGRPSPHVLVSVNLPGGTDYVAAGLDWTFGRTLYVRPGIGMAINNAPRPTYYGKLRNDPGSWLTFEPEIAFGWRAARGLKLEASWIHLSHATLFARQNRGLDSWGVRALVRIGRP